MTATHRHKRISEDITLRLQALANSGDLKPGDRLPPERQLAHLFGVSRNSVREAIKSLEQRGILVSRPGAGTFLVDNDEVNPAGVLSEVFALQRHRMDEIFELRLLLEPQIAHLAAQRADEHELGHLRSLMLSYQAALQEGRPAQDIEHAFHDAIAAATGNQTLVRLMDTVRDLVGESRDEALQSPQRLVCSVQDHGRILDALCRRDAEGTRQAMADHLMRTRDIVFTATSGE